MTTEATRKVVQEYYDTMPTGNREKLASLFTDDVEWYPPESAPFEPVKGAKEVAEALGGKLVKNVFDTRTIAVEVRKTIVEGDTAVVLQTLSGTALNGNEYSNQYCWVYECRDGKIARIEEYVDTWKAARIFEW